jgi:hypothetical protein
MIKQKSGAQVRRKSPAKSVKTPQKSNKWRRQEKIQTPDHSVRSQWTPMVRELIKPMPPEKRKQLHLQCTYVEVAEKAMLRNLLILWW